MDNMGTYGNLNEIKIFDAGEPDDYGNMLGRFSSKSSIDNELVLGSYLISTESPDIVITFDDKSYNDYKEDIKEAINDAYPEYDEEDEYQEEE